MRADQARQILNVGPGAAPREIRKAYRRLALRYHPDKNKSAEAKVKFTELQEALSVVTGPGGDAGGAGARGPGSTHGPEGAFGHGSGGAPGPGGDAPTPEALHRAQQFKAKLASLHSLTPHTPDTGRLALHHANLCRAATPTVQMRSTAKRTFESVAKARKWCDESGEPLLASWLEPRWSYEYEQATLDRWARRGAHTAQAAHAPAHAPAQTV